MPAGTKDWVTAADVNIVASKIVLDVNIKTSEITFDVNIKASETTLNVNIASAVTLDVNIKTSEATLNVNVASSVKIDVNLDSVKSGLVLDINIKTSEATLDVNLKASEVTLDVNIASAERIDVNIVGGSGSKTVVFDYYYVKDWFTYNASITDGATSVTLSQSSAGELVYIQSRKGVLYGIIRMYVRLGAMPQAGAKETFGFAPAWSPDTVSFYVYEDKFYAVTAKGGVRTQVDITSYLPSDADSKAYYYYIYWYRDRAEFYIGATKVAEITTNIPDTPLNIFYGNYDNVGSATSMWFGLTRAYQPETLTSSLTNIDVNIKAQEITLNVNISAQDTIITIANYSLSKQIIYFYKGEWNEGGDGYATGWESAVLILYQNASGSKYGIYSKHGFTYGEIQIDFMKWGTNPTDGAWEFLGFGHPYSRVCVGFWLYGTKMYCRVRSQAGITDVDITSSLPADIVDTYHSYRIVWKKTKCEFYIDGSRVAEVTTNIPHQPAYIFARLEDDIGSATRMILNSPHITSFTEGGAVVNIAAQEIEVNIIAPSGKAVSIGHAKTGIVDWWEQSISAGGSLTVLDISGRGRVETVGIYLRGAGGQDVFDTYARISIIVDGNAIINYVTPVVLDLLNGNYISSKASGEVSTEALSANPKGGVVWKSSGGDKCGLFISFPIEYTSSLKIIIYNTHDTYALYTSGIVAYGEYP